MPLGALLDQWEVYKQMYGFSNRKDEHFIDYLMPVGLH